MNERYIGGLIVAIPLIFIIGILLSQLNAMAWKTTAQVCAVTLERQNAQMTQIINNPPSIEDPQKEKRDKK
jgi:hypothetical protein